MAVMVMIIMMVMVIIMIMVPSLVISARRTSASNLSSCLVLSFFSFWILEINVASFSLLTFILDFTDVVVDIDDDFFLSFDDDDDDDDDGFLVSSSFLIFEIILPLSLPRLVNSFSSVFIWLAVLSSSLLMTRTVFISVSSLDSSSFLFFPIMMIMVMMVVVVVLWWWYLLS